MYSPFELAIKYLQYYCSANNSKGHGTHSPFVFEFIENVLNNKKEYYAYADIEQVRENLKYDRRTIEIRDLGAGSRKRKTDVTTVSEIAKTSLKPKKYAQLLFRMVDYYQPEIVVELGTSLGITSAYLAAANEKGKVVTFEGISGIATVAKENFRQLQIENIEVVEGNFDKTLNSAVSRLKRIDFAFLDGNHQKEATLNYFRQMLPFTNENSILVFDDIHWSNEMEQAWDEIISNAAVTLSIDLFFIGIVFFRKQQKAKQHFKIRF